MSNHIANLPDLEKTLRKARQEWERKHEASRDIQDRIGDTVPWWLVVISAVMFLLSVPHTSAMFSLITPGVGLLAPLGVEFGLLYAAFFRFSSQKKGTWVLVLFEVILVFASVIVNGTGSLAAVAYGVGLDDKSIGTIFNELGTLPVKSQVALALVPFAAIMIPAGTWVAGEGLAKLFLERRRGQSDREAVWRDVAGTVEYDALYSELVRSGLPPGKAAPLASRYIRGKHFEWSEGPASPRRNEAPDLKPDSADSHADTDTRTVADSSRTTDDGQDFLDLADPVAYVLACLKADPTLMTKSVRDVSAIVRVPKTSVGKAMQQYRAVPASSNGHSS